MVRMRYVGTVDPKAAFSELSPLRSKLLAMQNSYRPFGSDDLILAAVVKALDTAAYHFTGDPTFYAMRPAQSDFGRAED